MVGDAKHSDRILSVHRARLFSRKGVVMEKANMAKPNIYSTKPKQAL